jgi:hypothetical protein
MRSRFFRKTRNYACLLGLLPFLFILSDCGKKKSGSQSGGPNALNKNLPKNWSVDEDWADNPYSLEDLD